MAEEKVVNPKVKPREFFFFRKYIVAVRDWLRKNVYLSVYPEDENVTVAFQTPNNAFAKWVHPVINGEQLSPNISFHLSEPEYADNENNLGFVKEYLDHKDGKLLEAKPPLIYKLSFPCSIYSRNQPEMDVILYQITSKARFNKPAVFSVDGQWAQLYATNLRHETNLEPTDAQTKLYRWGLDLVIPRAYLPLDAETVGRIDSFEWDYEFPNENEQEEGGEVNET